MFAIRSGSNSSPQVSLFKDISGIVLIFWFGIFKHFFHISGNRDFPRPYAPLARFSGAYHRSLSRQVLIPFKHRFPCPKAPVPIQASKRTFSFLNPTPYSPSERILSSLFTRLCRAAIVDNHDAQTPTGTNCNGPVRIQPDRKKNDPLLILFRRPHPKRNRGPQRATVIDSTGIRMFQKSQNLSISSTENLFSTNLPPCIVPSPGGRR